ncbi:tape measure protein [Pediococcus acidilactici]|uniref:tape measure protein n=1 Tax=Pediococcus acidilactici TaxID=1254 RepID=UPI00132AEF07|nr:tape measure protein [Pediococcus acidilactici]KAF0340591.1 peptidoglycan DD-metalloendopeptidase family protein [Pediococcus acidilactici]KAF0380534.1 peptidoglycan DD-metalloendopeptidase family protein [Pediococcus acidilactici]KAF0453473.1 peptidoglycan DD-metalloendopeptidase family protein [Pediococcus acidilactici]KAF0463091.1 peptidoglycan DD-metalloendopeptidase family protein [Pediococcus acidilactici]KAF0488182.1 peptidoglycan DD-metalloendopeptidase family protein [Pediococcus a
MADGAINIDLKLKADKFNREIKESDKLVNEFGKNAGEKLDKAFKDNTDKVINKAKLTKKELKALFDKDTKVKIVAEAEKAGIKDFQKVLKKLPKQQKIELFTEMKDKGTINFSKKLRSMNRELQGDIKKLKSAYESTSSVQESYVNRLKAEGRVAKANKLKYKNLRASLKKEAEIYQKEHQLLTILKNDRTKNTDQITKQEIKVNKLAASLANNTRKMKELGKTQNAFNRNPFTKMTKGLLGLNKKANKTESVFKKVFSGVFWGEVAHGAASSALNVIKTGLGGIIKAGNEFNKEQQVMIATWTTLTGKAKLGKDMVKSINDMSNAFGQSNDLVNELDQQFYHVFNKKGPTEELTKSVLTMADTLGMSAEDTKRLGLNFTHMMTSSKMQLGDFNMISDQLPMFGERLLDYERKMQHNNALSMSELRDQMSAGKISAKDAENVMNGLGKKYKDASENMMKTAAGAERAIKGRFNVLAGKLAEPFTKMQSPIFEAVSKWVSDKRTEKEFSKVGTSASKGFKTITEALTKAFHINNGTKALDNMMDNIADGIEKLSNYIAKHSKQIVGFFKGIWGLLKIFGSIGVGFFKGIIDGIGLILKPIAKLVGHNKKVKSLSDALEELSKHKKGLEALGKVIAGIFIARKLAAFATGIVGIVGQLGKLKTAFFGVKTAATEAGEAEELATTMSGGGGGGGFFGNIFKRGKGGTKVAEEAGEMSRMAKNGSKFGLLSKLKGMSKFGKLAGGALGVGDVLMAGTDLLGMTKKTAGSHIGAFAGNLGGAAAGAAAGTAILPGIGTVIGAGVGALGGEKLGRILGKQIQKGLFNTKLKAPKISMKKAHDQLLKESKSYYSKKQKQALADLKTLKKNGAISKKEYQKEANAIKSAGKKANSYDKKNRKDQTAIAKYYAQEKQKLTKKWNSKIERDEKLYGKHSTQVQKDINNKKKALDKQRLKFATKVTGDEARLHTTLAGKIKRANAKMLKDDEKLTDKKKKLSRSEVKEIVKNADKEYDSVTRAANKKYKDVVRKADKQRDETIKAAKREYSGNSKWAKDKRKEAIDNANKQHDRVVNRAEKQKDEAIHHAKIEKDRVSKHADDRYKNVSKSADNEYEAQKKANKKKKDDNSGFFHTVGKWWNKFTSGISSLLKVFGDSKFKAPVMPVQYATGTGFFSGARRPITKATPVMLNDGFDSPETGNREVGILPNGELFSPQERNWTGIVPAGTEILNATESKMLFGGGLKHFASGTGWLSGIGSFVGGVVKGVKNVYKSLKKKFELAKNIISHPGKALDKLMGKPKKQKNSFFDRVSSDVFKPVKKQASDWWSALWDKISGSMGDEGGFGGVWAKSPGHGWQVTSGFGNRGAVSGGYSVHDGVDYSGAKTVHAMHGGIVSYAGGPPSGWGGPNGIGQNIVIKADDASVIYQELNGKYGSGASILVKKGDKVSTGQAIARLGPSGTHVHVGVSKGNPFGNSGATTKGWYDVRKMKASKSDEKQQKKSKDTGLSAFIEKQFGKSFFSRIAKMFAPFIEDAGGSGTGDPGGSGVHRWKSDVKSALSKLGLSTSASMVSRVLRQINTESGGNPKAMGGTDGLADGHAEGLMQVKPPTFRAYHLPGHNNIWNGYDNILAGLNYAKHRYGSGLSFLGNGHGYANGGWGRPGEISFFNEVPGEPEIAINPQRQSSEQHIAEAMIARAKNNPNGFAAKALNLVEKAKRQVQSMQYTQSPSTAVGGNVNIYMEIDSKTVAKTTYPTTKLLLGKDIVISNKR